MVEFFCSLFPIENIFAWNFKFAMFGLERTINQHDPNLNVACHLTQKALGLDVHECRYEIPQDVLILVPLEVKYEKMIYIHTRWAPTSYKWSYKPYKWPYKWVTGVITLLIGVITPLITSRGPTLYVQAGSIHSHTCK